jgi:hypothetical protein
MQKVVGSSPIIRSEIPANRPVPSSAWETMAAAWLHSSMIGTGSPGGLHHQPTAGNTAAALISSRGCLQIEMISSLRLPVPSSARRRSNHPSARFTDFYRRSSRRNQVFGGSDGDSRLSHYREHLGTNVVDVAVHALPRPTVVCLSDGLRACSGWRFCSRSASGREREGSSRPSTRGSRPTAAPPSRSGCPFRGGCLGAALERQQPHPTPQPIRPRTPVRSSSPASILRSVTAAIDPLPSGESRYAAASAPHRSATADVSPLA